VLTLDLRAAPEKYGGTPIHVHLGILNIRGKMICHHGTECLSIERQVKEVAEVDLGLAGLRKSIFRKQGGGRGQQDLARGCRGFFGQGLNNRGLQKKAYLGATPKTCPFDKRKEVRSVRKNHAALRS